VWDEAPGTPEVVAQAIAKIRQAMRRSKTHAVRVQTVYGKGYRLLVDARMEHDDTAAALPSQLQSTQQGRLVVVPLPGWKPTAGAHDHDLRYPLEVLGYTLAVHSQLHLMSAAEVQEVLDVSAAATPEAITAAMAGRSPGVHVLFAGLARRDEALSLEYVLVSPVARTEGSMLDRSPTALGRRLAAKLLRRPHSHSAHAEDDDAWMTEMLDLASRAAEEHLWGEALQVLDVVLDQDPDHGLAADFKARMRGRR